MLDTETYSPDILSLSRPLSSNITPKSWSVRSTNMHVHIQSYCSPNLDDGTAYAKQVCSDAILGTMLHKESGHFLESKKRCSHVNSRFMAWEMGGKRIVIWGLIASIGLVFASILLINQSIKLVRLYFFFHRHRFKPFGVLRPLPLRMSSLCFCSFMM